MKGEACGGPKSRKLLRQKGDSPEMGIHRAAEHVTGSPPSAEVSLGFPDHVEPRQLRISSVLTHNQVRGTSRLRGCESATIIRVLARTHVTPTWLPRRNGLPQRIPAQARGHRDGWGAMLSSAIERRSGWSPCNEVQKTAFNTRSAALATVGSTCPMRTHVMTLEDDTAS